MDELDELLAYAKETFNLDVSLVKSEEPDSFETLFKTSFLTEQLIEADKAESGVKG